MHTHARTHAYTHIRSLKIHFPESNLAGTELRPSLLSSSLLQISRQSVILGTWKIIFQIPALGKVGKHCYIVWFVISRRMWTDVCLNE